MLKTHPYMIFGFGSRFWTTYSVEDGVAYTRTWPSESRSIPLVGAKFDVSNSLLDFGPITIRSGGEALEWPRVKNRKEVLRLLELARSADPADMHDIHKEPHAFFMQEAHRGEVLVLYPDKTVVWAPIGESNIPASWGKIRQWLNKSYDWRGTWKLRGTNITFDITSPVHSVKYEGEFLKDRLVLRSSDKAAGTSLTFVSLPAGAERPT